MDKTTKDAFEKLNTNIEKGFAAIAEDATANKDELKADIARLDLRTETMATQIQSIEQEVKGIRRELEELRVKVENIEGYRKEIDHGLERIAAIERRLGMNRKVTS
ncbi:MAG TPA: DUF1664 domain-containing protein [Candidatus Paceibacterota bacterium]